MDEDQEMEMRELEAIADFYATLIAHYSAQIDHFAMENDEMMLTIAKEINLTDFVKHFAENYIDYLAFDKTIMVQFKQEEQMIAVQIN